MIEKEKCPKCGHETERYKNPYPTADVIVDIGGKVVLIKRKNPPAGWAIPGGFIDYGESAEDAAVREIREETGLEITGLKQFHTYSTPDRDPRFHTLTVVFTAKSTGTPVAGDDAAEAALFDSDDLPSPLAFDHEQVLKDYFESADRR
ncbi:NUDIX domain-containing protein [Candidatus Latescibacterota bacterium]